MNIEKCKTCKHYDDFFIACKLYIQETYLGEGDFTWQYYGITSIEPEECEYENKELLDERN